MYENIAIVKLSHHAHTWVVKLILYIFDPREDRGVRARTILL